MFRRSLNRLQPVLVVALILTAAGVSANVAEAARPKPVSVFPSPRTPVASDHTTFSFRGLKPGSLGKIQVVGSVTGRHAGKRLAHSDGHGVSFVPKKPFKPGELVRVRTSKRIKLARHGDFWVKIGDFYGNDDKHGKPGAPNNNPALHSRPDLKPPVLDVLASTPAASPGKIFFAPKGDGLTIADNAGRISFFRPTAFGGRGDQVLNFKAETYLGKPVLTYWKGSNTTVGFSQIGRYEILNSAYHKIASFTPGNGYKADIHEFRLTPRNTALVLSYRGVKADLRPYGGDAHGKVLDGIVQEIDIKTGAVLFEWHSIGSIGLKSGMVPPQHGETWDYIHLNSISDDGNSLLVSGRFTSSIYRIRRSDAGIEWRLRGDGQKHSTNDFDVADDAKWGFQHDAERLDNGDISLFDNGFQTDVFTVNENSSGLEVHLSGKGSHRKATLVKRYPHTPDPVQAASQGNMQTLANGNKFVDWGQVSRMTEFTPDGTVAFDAIYPGSEISSYRAFKMDWQGFPPDRPAIASDATAGNATVWASWNGANVAKWKVLTGSSESDLSEVATAPWADLETAIPVPSLGAKVQVVAYNYKDEEIGRSAVVGAGTQSR